MVLAALKPSLCFSGLLEQNQQPLASCRNSDHAACDRVSRSPSRLIGGHHAHPFGETKLVMGRMCHQLVVCAEEDGRVIILLARLSGAPLLHPEGGGGVAEHPEHAVHVADVDPDLTVGGQERQLNLCLERGQRGSKM